MVSFSPASMRHTMTPVNVGCQIQCRPAGRAQNHRMHRSGLRCSALPWSLRHSSFLLRPVILDVLCLNSWRSPRSESLGMVRRSIADHCADGLLGQRHLLHEQHLLEWYGARFATMDVATVLQNGACPIDMATVHRWPMIPNQTCDGGATFAPNGTVFTTNDILSYSSAMRSLRFHARGSTRSGHRVG